MKITVSFIITTLLIIGTFTSSNAQKQDCIICPEMLGIITSTENGVNISTLTPNQNATIILSNEKQKVARSTKVKSSKKTNRQKAKSEKNKNEVIGFAAVDSKKEVLEDCGCDGKKTEIKEEKAAIEVFTLYPNPAHHWVIINSKIITSDDNYKLFLKDAQGRIIKEREVSEASTKLDLRSLKQGVYFVTLRNEKDFSTTVKKVTVK